MPHTQTRRTVVAHIEQGAKMGRTQNAGTGCIVGAVIRAIGGAVTDIVQASTPVSDHVRSYLWSRRAWLPISLRWVLPTAVSISALCFVAFGVALRSSPAEAASVPDSIQGQRA